MKKTTVKYYTICTPTEKNVRTGNACVNEKDIFEFKKDFLFDQIVDGKRVTKVLPKEWVISHIDTRFATHKSKVDSTKNTVYSFQVIKIEDIMNFR